MESITKYRIASVCNIGSAAIMSMDSYATYEQAHTTWQHIDGVGLGAAALLFTSAALFNLSNSFEKISHNSDQLRIR